MFSQSSRFAALLALCVVVLGAYVRIHDAGLGCPDWPGCYGKANPFLAHDDISAAEAAMPTGPVTVFKAWIEMIHRYLAMGVGLLIIVTLVASLRLWKRERQPRHAPQLPALLLFFVCVQGAFGAWTVTLKLQPVIVTTHLLLGMSLLALLVWHAMRQSEAPAVSASAASLRVPAAIALGVLFMQIGLGGWVSTNYAVLACSDFPTCQGQWWPAMNWQGFALWRELGHGADGQALPFAALASIHYVHRCMAWLVLAVLLVMGWRLRTVPGLGKAARWLLWLCGLQFVTGLSNVVLDWPLLAAVLHTGGASALMVTLVWMLSLSRCSSFVSSRPVA